MSTIARCTRSATDAERSLLEEFLTVRCGLRNSVSRLRYIHLLTQKWEAEKERYNGDIKGWLYSLKQKAL